jgi:flagellar biogenesis protein FliO
MRISADVLGGESGASDSASSTSFWSGLGKKFSAGLSKMSIRRRKVSLRLQESLPLGERRSLVVVQWGDRRYLLGLTGQTVQVLDSRPSSPKNEGEADCEASLHP